MLVFRSLIAILLGVLPSLAATFGTVVPDPNSVGLSDLVLDEARSRLYAVNTVTAQLEVFSTATNPPRLSTNVRLNGCTSPISAAVSRPAANGSSKYIYITCYDSTALMRLDLDNLTAAGTLISLAAKPQGVAVAYDDKVVVSTIGTGQSSAVLLWFDPNADASRNLQNIPIAPPAPTPPQLPPPSGRVYEGGRGRLLASADGRKIVGVNEYNTSTRAIFVYDAASATVVRSRYVSSLSPVLSISPDGSKFMAGLTLFDTNTLQVLAQQNAANAPFTFPGGGSNNFNTQQNQGGSVFSPDGSMLFTAFNIAPIQNPPARANVSRLLVNDPDNLLIQLGIQLAESLAGKMVITRNGGVIYALSESGFIVLPIASLSQFPLAIPDSPVKLLAKDQCGVVSDMNTGTVNVTNYGGGSRMTVTAQILQVTNTGPVGLGGTGPGGGGGQGNVTILLPPAFTGGGAVNIGVPTTSGGFGNTSQNNSTATAPQVKVTQNGNGSSLAFNFSNAAARTLGTVPPSDFLIQSAEAINIPPNVRVYQNNRNSEAKGTVIPVPIGVSNSEGLVDMLMDNTRQKVYIANSGMNRLEVFDIRKGALATPIKVGQLPRSLAMDQDGVTMYVANNGSEYISIVDLDRGAVTGRINFPPIPFNAATAVVTPSTIVATQRGPLIIMSDGTLWKVVGNEARPRVLPSSIFGTNARTISGPVRTMAASPEGRYAILLAGNGNAYLYSSDQDEFVNVRQVFSNPITGYYGPIAAGPNGSYYLVNNLILNSALTPTGAAPTFTFGAGGVPIEDPSTTTDPNADPTVGPTSGIGSGFPTRGGPTTVSRPVSAVASAGARSFVRFSMPIRLSQNATATDAGQVELVDVSSGRTLAIANALEGPLASGTVNSRVNTNGRTMAVDAAGTTAYVATTAGLSIIPLDRSAALDTPSVTRNGILNSASYQGTVAPGSLVSIFGKALSPGSTSAPATPLPTVLGGVCVTLNNTPMPLLMTSPTQINAQLPPTLAAGRYQVVVRSIAKQAASSSTNLTVAKYAPAVFVDNTGTPMIYHKNNRIVNKSAPAQRDEPLTIFAAGLGVTKGGKVVAGAPSPSSPLAVTDKVQLYFGNPSIKEAEVIVDWSGLVPGLIGVYQINARVPGAHVKGDALPVTLKIGGVTSPTTGPVVPKVYVE